jgi:hypothetical protein
LRIYTKNCLGGDIDVLNRTYGGDEVDDDEGVENGDNGCGNGRHNVAQALQTPKESQDSEGPQYLDQKMGAGISGCYTGGEQRQKPTESVGGGGSRSLNAEISDPVLWFPQPSLLLSPATCVPYPQRLDGNVDRTERHERQRYNDKIKYVPVEKQSRIKIWTDDDDGTWRQERGVWDAKDGYQNRVWEVARRRGRGRGGREVHQPLVTKGRNQCARRLKISSAVKIAVKNRSTWWGEERKGRGEFAIWDK